MNKTQIRQRIAKEKKLLTPLAIIACAQDFCDKISKHKAFIESKHVAFYCPCNNELDVMPALQHAIELGKKCYLPHTTDTLQFIQVDNNTDFVAGKYKIPSPAIKSSSILMTPSKLDLVIMPAVAIAKNHYRVGMGKGYYDKAFSFKKSAASKPKLIAACYSFQIISDLEPEPWDIKCDDYITA